MNINSIKVIANKVVAKTKKHSPEILVASGIIGTIATTVVACKETTKAGEILEEAKEQLDQVHMVRNGEVELKKGVTYTDEDYKKDLTIVYVQTGVRLFKLYLPAVILGGLSIASILGGYNILNKRNIALASAYATIENSFKEYRDRVIERFGEDIDKELKYNIVSKVYEETETDKKGNEKTVEKEVKVSCMDGYSNYARFFDDGCLGWENDAEHNLFVLKSYQNYANDKLKAQGHLFLNEVYDMLGIPKTKAGQIVGWIWDPHHPENMKDGFVDFNIYNINRERNRDFVNGYEKTILLDFNVDGNILDLI